MKCDPVLTVLRANATGGAATPADSTLERLERLSEERAAKQATELSAEKKAIREAKGRQKLTDEYVQKYNKWIVAEHLSRPGMMRRNWKQTLLSDGHLLVRHPNWDEAYKMSFAAATDVTLHAGG
jgi:hypothetical protein